MSDIISRQALIDTLVERTHMDWESMKILHPALEVIDNLPSAEPKHGKWEHWVSNEDQTNSLWRCTSCGTVLADRKYFLWKYCPNCGAKMEADHDTD